MDGVKPFVDREAVLEDGRRVGYAIWGDPDGQPAVLCHGSPASRLFTPDPGITAELGLRLITVDRPGYGNSSPQPGRTFLGWAGDLAQLMDQLKVRSSAGGALRRWPVRAGLCRSVAAGPPGDPGQLRRAA